MLWFFVSRAYRVGQHFRIGGYLYEPLFAGLKAQAHINFAIKGNCRLLNPQDCRSPHAPHIRLLKLPPKAADWIHCHSNGQPPLFRLEQAGMIQLIY